MQLSLFADTEGRGENGGQEKQKQFDLDNLLHIVVAAYEDKNTDNNLDALAKKFGLSTVKIRKLLITAGVRWGRPIYVFGAEKYETLAKKVLALHRDGKSIRDIMALTGLKQASVYSYLPYVHGAYNMKEFSSAFERIQSCRDEALEQRDIQERISSLSQDKLDDALWESIVYLQGYTFKTSRGLKFSYQINGGEIYVNRKSKPITKSSVLLAFHNALEVQMAEGYVSGPKKLKAFGASYLYSIFLKLGFVRGKEKESIGQGREAEMLNGAVGAMNRAGKSAVTWPSELLLRPATDLKVSNDIVRTLYRSGVTIVAQLLLMSTENILAILKDMKSESCLELFNQMAQLKNQRECYFDDSQKIENHEAYKAIPIGALGLNKSAILPSNISEILMQQGVTSLYALIESYNQKFVLLSDVDQKTVDELLLITGKLDLKSYTDFDKTIDVKTEEPVSLSQGNDKASEAEFFWPLKVSPEQCKKVSVEDLDISTRARNALLRNGISNLYAVVNRYFSDTLSGGVRIGDKTVREIGKAIGKLTYSPQP